MRVVAAKGGEALLPAALLRLSTFGSDGTIVPHYLTERDHPWLRAVLDEHARFVGKRRSALQERMREPLPLPAPKAKLRFVAGLLERLGEDRTAVPVPPREARDLTFRAAKARPFVRDHVLARIAGELHVSPAELEIALFADLKSERLVAELPSDLDPSRSVRLDSPASSATFADYLRAESRTGGVNST
jgi:predicted nuclease of restriction endonuclease-like RecB superfamily